MLCPALTINDLEDMTIQEISNRVSFFNDIKIERDRIKSIEFFSILSECIACGYNYGHTGKRKAVTGFIKSLKKVFNNKEIEEENIFNPEEAKKIIRRERG